MPGLRELQKSGVGIDGGLQQRDVAIGAVQLKIILRQVRLVGELGVFELRLGGLRGLGVRSHVAPDAAPQVHLIGDIERNLIGGVNAFRGRYLIGRNPARALTDPHRGAGRKGRK